MDLQFLSDILRDQPLVALFICISLGYLLGKLKYKSFKLGGIAGTLIVSVVIGQLGIELNDTVRTVFFALFIYAVGFQGGPQFFRALNRRSLNQLLSAVLTCVLGLLTVLVAAWTFGLDRGLAAGLAAGGLTQSAIIGTAGDAIANLGLPADVTKQMQSNVAVGYAVTYIFGSLGPILLISWFLPMIKKWDIRSEAIKLAAKFSGGRPELEDGQFNGMRSIITRCYRVAPGSPLVNQSSAEFDRDLDPASVESVVRNGKQIEAGPDTTIHDGDLVVVTGTRESLEPLGTRLGAEAEPPAGLVEVEEKREVVLTNRALVGSTLGDVHQKLNGQSDYGIFFSGVRRGGKDLPTLQHVELHRGDEITLVGRPTDIDRAQKQLGYPIPAGAVTDFVFFGLGIAIGMLIGLIEVPLFGVSVSIGTGGGCLVSGLVFGWLRGVHPRFASLPTGASNFLRDFGLAAFVGAVGLGAGAQALTAIKQSGLSLLLLGVCVTLIPTILSFFLSYYLLRIRNPIELLAAIAGGRSANPAFAALMGKAGNATPVVPFTITYAVANVLLTLWGPIIVNLVTTNVS
ncbi:aspartate-alanine antiporter [Corynebacterium pacaense]|uniref:aspartate-alanine antiporter n=1 Tax=Corynebacterium pacaense TaxID=1816684 RepID=UPI0009BB2F93|nr:aspartate-alanine antiporter [Corynebacterium pacaense]